MKSKITSKNLKKLFSLTIKVIMFLAAVLGIYLLFYFNKVQIQYEILSTINVFDINEDIENLDVLYDGKSLKKDNESLKIISLKIKNSGQKDILSSFYDDADLLGFSVQDGKIIKKPEILEASNNLNERLDVNLITENQVRFAKAIFDSKDYVVLKVFVLHNIGEMPKIIPEGKIAGVKNIELVDSSKLTEPEQSFLDKTFKGNILIQITRGIGYFIVVLLLVIGIIILFDKISKIQTRKKREKLVNRFKKLDYYRYKSTDDVIFNEFVKNDIFKLKRIDQIIRDQNLLRKVYQNYTKDIKKREDIERKMPDSSHRHLGNVNLIKDILELGFAIENKTNDGSEIIAQNGRKDTLKKFVKFVYKNNKNLLHFC